MQAGDRTGSAGVLRFPNKRLRSRAIVEHVRKAGYPGVVVFTCGNAATALRQYQGLQVIEVGPRGDLNTSKWWTPAEIHAAWPTLFDATSGHLPLPLMHEIAKDFRAYFSVEGRELDGNQRYYVPTGSGETIICMRMAFPAAQFVAVYDNTNPATTRDNDAPLNAVVDAWFPVEYWNGVLDI